jgi:hypothetical protein
MNASPWAFGWDALVAIGTLSLAAVTLILAVVTTLVARKTGKLASTTEREVEAVLRHVAIAEMGVSVSREANAGNVRPVLIAVPVGRFGGPTDSVEVPGLAERIQFNEPATVFFEYRQATLFVSVPFRNEGAGIAFMDSGLLVARDGDHEWPGVLSTTALPPHEIVRVSFGLGPEEAEAVPTSGDGKFSVVARYSDLAGAIWASRLELKLAGATWQATGVLLTPEGQTTEVGGGTT